MCWFLNPVTSELSYCLHTEKPVIFTSTMNGCQLTLGMGLPGADVVNNSTGVYLKSAVKVCHQGYLKSPILFPNKNYDSCDPQKLSSGASVSKTKNPRPNPDLKMDSDSVPDFGNICKKLSSIPVTVACLGFHPSPLPQIPTGFGGSNDLFSQSIPKLGKSKFQRLQKIPTNKNTKIFLKPKFFPFFFP